MKKRVYLDNCCFNRPFDDQSDFRIKMETEAKLEIQQKIQDNDLELVWSYMLDFENAENPFNDRKEAISRWRQHAVTDIQETQALIVVARQIATAGVKNKDAIHVACALSGACRYFITTDDAILSRLRDNREIKVLSPVQFILGEML